MTELEQIASPPDKTNLRRENQLALKLKLICDENGKELDTQKSAIIFYQLAKVYETRSPDLFSLIKSAALYNAAIARSPGNEKDIVTVLKNLCKHILLQAEAKKQDADLIEKAKEVKQAVMKMRDKAKQSLSEIESISDDVQGTMEELLEKVRIKNIEQIQHQITKDYISIMADVAAYCEDVMGLASCKYALVGMGSMARKEITPYSDFENIILLKNRTSSKNTEDDSLEKYIDRFRWFAVIFQTILINLQETIIPSVAIFSLNDESSQLGDWFYDVFTTRGISFDGMMPHACKFPLGRQQLTESKPWKTELIRPVNEMLDYLSSKESLKNGYHLSDILTKTCFVYKSKEIFEEFENKVFQRLEAESNNLANLEEIKKQILDDLGNFATRLNVTNLKTKAKLNVKRIVYRSTTLFISALGRLNNIRASSCFDIVRELSSLNVISSYAKHKLMFAVSIACQIRLRWYMKKKRQCDDISDEEGQGNAVAKLLEIVGKKCTISYFQTAYALQCDISKRLNLSKHHFYSNPTLLNQSLGHLFNDETFLRNFFLKYNNKSFEEERFPSFDDCLKSLEAKSSIEYDDTNLYPHDFQIQGLGINLIEMGCLDDALECFQILDARLQTIECKQYNNFSEKRALESGFENIASNNFMIGYIMIMMKMYEKASEYLQKSIWYYEKKLSYDTNSLEPSDALFKISLCYLLLNKTDWAISYLQKLRLHKEETSAETICSDLTFAYALYFIGRCLIQMKKSDEAIQHFQKSVQLHELSSSYFSQNNLALVLFWTGRCFFDINEPDEAICYLYRSLEIRQELSPNVNADCTFASILHWVGRCYILLQFPAKAVEYFKRSLCINEHILQDLQHDRDVARNYFWIGRCYFEMRLPGKALDSFQKSLYVTEKTQKLLGKDASETWCWICFCFIDLNNPQEAAKSLKKLRTTKEKLNRSFCTVTEQLIACVFYGIGTCFLNADNPGEALKYLQNSLSIQEQLPFNEIEYNIDVADVTHILGICCLDLNKPNDALIYFEKSMHFNQQTSHNNEKDKKIALSLYWISCCFQYMNKREEAQKYVESSIAIMENFVIQSLFQTP